MNETVPTPLTKIGLSKSLRLAVEIAMFTEPVHHSPYLA